MTTTIIVPCYIEAVRLPVDPFRASVAEPSDLNFLFVDDGSTDGTAALIASLVAEHPERFSTLSSRSQYGQARSGTPRQARGTRKRSRHSGCLGRGSFHSPKPTPPVPACTHLATVRPNRHGFSGAHAGTGYLATSGAALLRPRWRNLDFLGSPSGGVWHPVRRQALPCHHSVKSI